MIRRIVGALVAAILISTALPAAAAEPVVPSPTGAFLLKGHGYGHGHGLSQWGAYGAARSGLTTPQILAFYYPGTILTGQQNTDIRVGISSPVSRAGEVAVDVAGSMTLRTESGTVSLPASVSGAAPVLSWRLASASTGLALSYTDSTTGSWKQYPLSVPGTFASFQSSTGIVRLVLPSFERRAYRGFVGALRTTSGVSTINTVAMEDYLRSVVPSEMPASWHPQALGAQTVAARTYASFDRHSKTGVQHTCDTTACQVYRGFARYSVGGALIETFENGATDSAIAATQNQVLVTGGPFSYAFTQFSAANGGWTAGTSYSYMPAKPDPYDGVIPNNANSWDVTLSAATMRAAFPGIGDITKIVVLARDGNGEWGGRTTSVRVEGSSGSRTVTGNAFRSALGLKSQWWTTAYAPATTTQTAGGLVADITGDGYPDLLARNATTGLLLLYPGTTGAPGAPVTVGSGWDMHDLLLLPGDFTGDGIPDIVARERSTGYLWMYPLSRSGVASAPTSMGYGWGSMSAITAPGDVTGDGRPDLYAREAATGNLYVYTWDANLPGGSVTRSLANTGWGMHDAIIGVGDVSGDGRPDLVARQAATGALFLYTTGAGGSIVTGGQVNSGWGQFDMLLGGLPLGSASGSAILVRDPSRDGGTLRSYTISTGGSIAPGRDLGTGWNMHSALL